MCTTSIYFVVLLFFAFVCDSSLSFLWRRPFGITIANRNAIMPISSNGYRFDGISFVPDGPDGYFPTRDQWKKGKDLPPVEQIDLDSLPAVITDQEEVPFDDPVFEDMRLEEKHLPDERMYMDDLQAIWEEYCEVNNITDVGEAAFAVEKVLPLVMKDDTVLKIEEKRPLRYVPLIPHYWSNKDLRDLWDAWKPDPPELKSANFSFYEAWALVPDQNASDPDINIVTEKELRRIWKDREVTTLGMPAAKFSIKDALKLITPMRIEEDTTEFETAIEQAERLLRQGEPKKDLSHIQDPALREQIDRLLKWMNRKDTIRSPNLPRQLVEFYHDVSSDLHTPNALQDPFWTSTQSVHPVLDNDLSELSEPDDFPGQFPPEVDTLLEPWRQFPEDKKLWEVYDIPGVGPKYHPAGTKTRAEIFQEEWEEEQRRVAALKKELDAQKAERENKRPRRVNPLTMNTEPRKAPKKMHDTEESFFDYFDTKEGLDPDDFPGINGIRAKHYTEDQRYMWDRNFMIKQAAVFPRHIREEMDDLESAPERYAQRLKDHHPDQDSYTDYDHMALYNASFFELGGDRMTDEDQYYLDSMNWYRNFTDQFMESWLKFNEELDEEKYREMVEEAELFGTPVGKEPIPEHLMPERWRGVNYSMELFESFSKTTLTPFGYYDDPTKTRLQFENETFEPNPDVIATRAQGTIMLQYDWAPSDNRTFSIDPAVAELLEPLQEFAGDLVKLQSTSEGLIIYDYFGPVRHIIGIRATMRYYAQQLDPTIKDVRLETPRLTDPSDHTTQTFLG